MRCMLLIRIARLSSIIEFPKKENLQLILQCLDDFLRELSSEWRQLNLAPANPFLHASKDQKIFLIFPHFFSFSFFRSSFFLFYVFLLVFFFDISYAVKEGRRKEK